MLNVVIEVGCVGKYGKGFVVVVDIVRILVEKVEKNVVNIESFIKDIFNGVEMVLNGVKLSF